MELLSIANAVAVLALALIVGRQSRVLDDNNTYIANLEEENAYMDELLHTPFDQLDLIGHAGLDE